MSEKSIFTPMYKNGMLVAVHVNTGAITSSPGFKPARIYDRCNASVPDPTAIAGNFDANFLLKPSSNNLTFGPWPIQRVSKTSITADFADFGTCG
jgi:hypothetical protein